MIKVMSLTYGIKTVYETNNINVKCCIYLLRHNIFS